MDATRIPIQISIGTMTVNSGIYIGNQNVVLGMSSHSKSNSGLGSIDSNNTVQNNLNIVFDPDTIDTPIDDRDVHIFQQIQATPTPQVTQIGFDTIQVATISQNSGVFVGDVQVTGLDAHSKQNSGRASTFGSTNLELNNVNIVQDSDVIDAPIHDEDVKILHSTNGPG